MQSYSSETGARVRFATSRCDKHNPDFPWVKPTGCINEVYDVGLMGRVVRASSQGADRLSQKYRARLYSESLLGTCSNHAGGTD